MSTEDAATLLILSGSHGSAIVVRAIGELDYDYAPTFRRELSQAWTSGTDDSPTLVLDLAGLTFCDSTGLAELLWILRRSQENGTRLVLAGVSRTLHHMLTTTGVLPYFTLSASVEEALQGG